MRSGRGELLLAAAMAAAAAEVARRQLKPLPASGVPLATVHPRLAPGGQRADAGDDGHA